ncbi:MAG: RNA polymerase factor sigma-54 [Spirochaetaceae bacterium]|jgi:RNA polymerase sigma-54 factor|nr:RNA polymerase factor sigma-54 [Spirochaetaceae bacterium]
MLGLSQKLGVSLEQGLHLSQQMLHSIKLMELPVMELRERIEAEVAANPALDVVDEVKEAAPEEKPRTEDEDGDFFETAITLYSNRASSREDDEKRQFLEGAVSRPESLQDYLLWQFRLQTLAEDVRRIGELLIGNLNEDGFHLVHPAELLPGEDPAKIEAALSVIRALDPQGCATADYRESLAVQGRLRFSGENGARAGDIYAGGTRAEGARSSAEIEALLPYLGELEKGRFSHVAKMTGIKADRAAFLFACIKELSPFPGRQYSGGGDSEAGVRFVVPDIEVYRKDGELVIRLNDDEIPALRVNPFFADLKKYKQDDQNTRDFVNENVAGAKWFINAVQRRNHTLLRVMRAIVERQKAFFEKGPAHIAPLTRHDIAETLELDDSTVSRMASSKYIQTEWGIYGMGHFFSNAITGQGSQGSPFSKTGVKEVIREIITHSEKHASDSEIARVLEERGIKIARRTVAKYRNEL